MNVGCSKFQVNKLLGVLGWILRVVRTSVVHNFFLFPSLLQLILDLPMISKVTRLPLVISSFFDYFAYFSPNKPILPGMALFQPIPRTEQLDFMLCTDQKPQSTCASFFFISMDVMTLTASQGVKSLAVLTVQGWLLPLSSRFPPAVPAFPKSLMSQCRLAVRRFMKLENHPEAMDRLDIPLVLLNYLKHQV